ncbi:MAG: hypothetical protein EZS28_019937 [Streblomastix strix]|uniref:Uncharacterized protein n=1 Tax=Streblomastix strix TaxID=222440 RepID=A0A5J4VPX0_9EUKA|nr:MAG: hypothetical protein EZS28_019937 [Streblomastix strix]
MAANLLFAASKCQLDYCRIETIQFERGFAYKCVNWTIVELKRQSDVTSYECRFGVNWTIVELKQRYSVRRYVSSYCVNWTIVELKPVIPSLSPCILACQLDYCRIETVLSVFSDVSKKSCQLDYCRIETRQDQQQRKEQDLCQLDYCRIETIETGLNEGVATFLQSCQLDYCRIETAQKNKNRLCVNWTIVELKQRRVLFYVVVLLCVNWTIVELKLGRYHTVVGDFTGVNWTIVELKQMNFPYFCFGQLCQLDYCRIETPHGHFYLMGQIKCQLDYCRIETLVNMGQQPKSLSVNWTIVELKLCGVFSPFLHKKRSVNWTIVELKLVNVDELSMQDTGCQLDYCRIETTVLREWFLAASVCQLDYCRIETVDAQEIKESLEVLIGLLQN